MKYIIIISLALFVLLLLLMTKNFNVILKRASYVLLALFCIVGVVFLIQPDDYIVYNSDKKVNTDVKSSSKESSKIQYLALKMQSEGFTEDEIIESFYHEYDSNIKIAQELKKAGFSLVLIQKYFKNYELTATSKQLLMSKEDYSRYIIEQDIKRLSSFSKEQRERIRKLETNSIAVDEIKREFPKYEPNDEVKARELYRLGKSINQIKKVYPNYQPKN